MTSTMQTRHPAVEREPIHTGEPMHTGVLKIANPVLATVLRSPLHRHLDAGFRPRLLLPSITGRRAAGRRTRSSSRR
jgi:hypothetical protein